MIDWIIGLGTTLIISFGIVIYQNHQINNLDIKVNSQSEQIMSLTQQRLTDQTRVNNALAQVREAQNERNRIAAQLANIKDQQSLDWLHANIPLGMRDILQGTRTAPAN